MSEEANPFEHGIHGGMFFNVYQEMPGVSKSQLDRLARSPAHLRAYLDAPQEEPTREMLIGTATHTALFEPEFFGEGKSHYVRPIGLTFTSKEGRAWRDAHQGKPIFDYDEAAIARACYKRELLLYADCKAHDQWPCYETEIQTVSLPAWAKIRSDCPKR